LAGETILVVDDGQENRDFVVEYILTPNGYKSLVAKDGKEGLDMALEYRPDLILLDLQMPRLNGIQVLKALNTQQADIPIILMTFHGSEEIAVEVYRLGVRDYVKKPYSVDEMLEAIERSLAESRLRRDKEALTERLIQANRELQLSLQELNVLYGVGKSVTTLMDMDQLLPRIVDAAAQITHAEEGFLYLVQDDGLLCRSQKRYSGNRAEAASFQITDRVAMHVVENGQPLLLSAEQLARQPGNPQGLAYAPMVLRNEVIGILGVRNITAEARPFTKQDLAILSALTDYAAIAIENSRNFEALRYSKENENAKIRNTFKRFVPPPVVDQVLDHPEKLQIGGKRQEVTIMFADIRGYTAWSENADPEKVMVMLNDYLSLAAGVIASYGGTLDKYLGDGIMAMFNAPEEQENHVHQAAEAALMLQQAAEELATQRGDTGLSVSVGMHIGEALVGYVGTDFAVNYTAIGDVVNLAKRLQEAASPGQILVEEAVIKRLGDAAQCRALGEIKVRGRQKQARAYELQGLAVR
jgi:class 3 adenylate cyclase/DNA-binding response OmpR family regulator